MFVPGDNKKKKLNFFLHLFEPDPKCLMNTIQSAVPPKAPMSTLYDFCLSYKQTRQWKGDFLHINL